MNIFGYSERGALNALFYEIACSRESEELFHNLIALASFPFTEKKPLAGSVDLLIEQSFSDFGDADVVALISGLHNCRCSLFMEAKVKTFGRSDWLINDEFDRFLARLQGTVSSSNLFTQMYHKLRLVDALWEGGITALTEGVQFPTWSTKPVRKIGNNGVVIRAVDRLERYAGDPYFLAIVPDTPERVKAFFKSILAKADIDDNNHWDVSRFGFITWSQIQNYCEQVGLTQTLSVLKFNQGRIYLD